MLRLWKTSGIYKDFRKSFHEVWSELFHNYTIILVSLFGKEAPGLHTALAEFYSNIYELSTVYEWQDKVFPMAIEAYLYIVAQKPTISLRWVILAKFQGRFCTARTLIGIRAKITDNNEKRSKSPLGRSSSLIADQTTLSSPLISLPKAIATWLTVRGLTSAKVVGQKITGCRGVQKDGKNDALVKKAREQQRNLWM